MSQLLLLSTVAAAAAANDDDDDAGFFFAVDDADDPAAADDDEDDGGLPACNFKYPVILPLFLASSNSPLVCGRSTGFLGAWYVAMELMALSFSYKACICK